MARRPRIHVPGGLYHVTLRGNHRQAIFFAEADRQLLDSIVAETILQFDARVHAYCWMTNHVHALVQVGDTPLGKIVLKVASRYARLVQVRLETTGHLFERRYFALLVQADSHLLEVVRYIHLNPVRAGLVEDPAQYRWSSHHAYLRAAAPPWVTTTLALAMFDRELGRARAAYARFVAQGHDVRFGVGPLACHPDDCRVLGDDGFLRAVRTDGWRPPSRQTLNELVSAGCQRFGVSEELLISSSKARRLTQVRAYIAGEALVGRVASLSAVARRLNRSESALRELLISHPQNRR